jgi:hypothetical protein
VLLAIGFVTIVGASAREAALGPGQQPAPADVRRGRIAMAGAAAVVAGAVWFGNGWCNSEDGVYRRYVFKPLVLIPSIEDSRLRLALEDPGWLNRRTDDLHGDSVHANGLPETAPAEIDLPESPSPATMRPAPDHRSLKRITIAV